VTDFLERGLPGSSVILYGSCARGEDDYRSDVDLLIVCRKTEPLELGRFEKSLGRRIMVLMYAKAEREGTARGDRSFYEGVLVNGIVLQGSLPVVNL
jgi:predicted nucleotidyltransferase